MLERTTSNQLTSSREASPVSLSVSQESAVVTVMGDGSGLNSTVSFASLSPDGCWLKMYQGYCQATMGGSLEIFSGTWPQAGTMRNGRVYRRRRLVPRISVRGSTSWPTPTATDWKREGRPATDARRWHRYVAGLYRSCVGPNIKWAAVYGTRAPIALWEWLMGFPIGWSELEDTEIASSPKSPSTSVG